VAITGAHFVLYTPEADALRTVLGQTLGWRSVDAGDGWLIFALPPAELGVHPSEQPHQELTLMCDDIEATSAQLRDKGIEVRGEPQDQGWGITTTLVLPGGVEVLLYEPRHPTAL
jgi:hypothetical protein